MATTDDLTLVLGATGKTGRRVAERLAARGVPTRLGSRSAEPPFDWENDTTWPAALEGATAAYVSYFPDVAVPGAADVVGAFARTAVEHGVRRLVLLSGRGEEQAQRAELAVQESGAEWTVVRASWFMQNFSESYFLEPVLGGEVALPVDTVREPFVDADDIADVAVAALTEPGHRGRVYEVTGPRALTFAEAVGEIARAAGRQVTFVPVTIDEYSAALAEHGLGEPEVALITYLFAEVLDGRNEATTDGVQRALDRAPRDFADYAARTAAAGVWSVAALSDVT